MKKIFLGIVILLQILGITVLGNGEIQTTNSTIYINNEVASFSTPTVSYNSRTLVPMRELFEKLGAQVEWVASEKKIIAKTKTKTIEMSIDDNWTICNSISIYVDTPAVLYNNKTMVPLRFVGEQLNLKVEWDGDSNTIKLFSIGEITLGTLKKEEKDGNFEFSYEYTGEIIDGMPYGIGKLVQTTIYKSKDGTQKSNFVTEGSIHNWNRDGYSTTTTNLGIKTGGNFINNIRNGWNYYTDQDGNYFSANYDNDEVQDDIGYIKYKNGNEYSGKIYSDFKYLVDGETHFIDNWFVPHGYGEMKYKDGGKFVGNWEYNKRSGEGKGYWANGNLSYEGVFENDGLNGWGKDFYESGELLYEGGHWNAAWTNYGKVYHKDGVVEYEGNWDNDKKIGRGKATYYYENTNITSYTGDVIDGQRDGLGKEYYSNGKLKYEGEFTKGGYNGFGKLYKPDGTLDYDGIFTYNENTGKSTWYNNNPTYIKPNVSNSTPSVIESSIDGNFEGWSGNTIFKLMNGQIWQQDSYSYHYHYSFMPNVIIYKSGAQYKMKVDGVTQEVVVKQLK